jgi:hypothetical protein
LTTVIDRGSSNAETPLVISSVQETQEIGDDFAPVCVVDNARLARRFECDGLWKEDTAATASTTGTSGSTGAAATTAAAPPATTGTRARSAAPVDGGGSLRQKDNRAAECRNAAG